MIEILRSASKSWVAKILLGLLVLSFLVFGLDQLRRPDAQVVAQVGDTRIEIREVNRAFMQTLQTRFAGQLSPADARNLGVPEFVLSELVVQALMVEEAKRLGVQAPDEALRLRITSDPSFRVGGVFSADAYAAVLRSQGLRQQEFEERQRDQITTIIMQSGLSAGAAAPRFPAERLWMHQNEMRDIAYIRLALDSAPAPAPPTEETLRAFHVEEAERFTAPEYREVGFIWVRAVDFADPDAVADDRARALYDDRLASFERPERRNVERVLFATEAEATAAAARLADGDSFSRILEDAGYTQDDAALGYRTEAELAADDPALAQAVFAAPAEGGPLPPFETAAGWSLAVLDGVEPARVTTFEEAAPALRQELALGDARRRLAEVANAIEDLRAAGASFEEAAEQEGVTAGAVLTDRSGLDPEGRPARGLPPGPETLDRAFAMAIGEEMDLIPTPGAEFFALEVRSVTPPELRPFDAVRSSVEDDWVREQRRMALAELAGDALSRLASGETLAALATELGASVETEPGVRRGAGPRALPPEALTALFAPASTDAVGAAAAAPSVDGGGHVIAQVSAVTPADPASDAAEIDIEALRANWTRSLAQDLITQYVREVQLELEFDFQEDVRRSALDIATGAATPHAGGF